MSGSLTSGERVGAEIGRPVLTVRGMLSLWGGGLLLGAGFWRHDGALLWLGCALWLVVVVARWWAPRNLVGLRVRRMRPARVFVGETFAVELSVDFDGDEGRWLRRAGRETLIRDGLLGKRSTGVWIARGLGMGDLAEATVTAKLHQRGRETRTDFEARSSFPLGLFEVVARGLLEDETLAADEGLIVFPRPWLPQKVRRDLELGRYDLEALPGVEPEPGEEFRGIRDYRTGDPVKAVHWPATARTGRLMVREWDPPSPRPARYGLLLHTWESGGRLLRPERWEMALRLAAGLMTHCREAGISLWLVEEIGDLEEGTLVEMPEQVAFFHGLTRLALARRGRARDSQRLGTALEKLQIGCDRIFVVSDVPMEQWQEVVEGSGVRKPILCLDPDRVAPVRKRKKFLSR